LADSNVLVIAAVVVVLLVIVVVARVVVVVVVVVVVAAAVVGVIVVAAAAAGAPVRIQTVPLTLERCYNTESSWNSEHTTVGPLIKKTVKIGTVVCQGSPSTSARIGEESRFHHCRRNHSILTSLPTYGEIMN